MVSHPNSLPLPFQTPATQANTEVAIESVPINGGPFKARLNLEKMSGLFFPRGETKLSVILRCP